jgi:hypothetical protein
VDVDVDGRSRSSPVLPDEAEVMGMDPPDQVLGEHTIGESVERRPPLVEAWFVGIGMPKS